MTQLSPAEGHLGMAAANLASGMLNRLDIPLIEQSGIGVTESGDAIRLRGGPLNAERRKRMRSEN